MTACRRLGAGEVLRGRGGKPEDCCQQGRGEHLWRPYGNSTDFCRDVQVDLASLALIYPK